MRAPHPRTHIPHASMISGSPPASPRHLHSATTATAPCSAFLTENNAERLANALCRMRGAALKLGQMLSIQDENVLPPQFQAALERVRAGADVMPRRQLEGVLVAELGPHWRAGVAEFDYQPLAAASIGQVRLRSGKRGKRGLLGVCVSQGVCSS